MLSTLFSLLPGKDDDAATKEGELFLPPLQRPFQNFQRPNFQLFQNLSDFRISTLSFPTSDFFPAAQRIFRQWKRLIIALTVFICLLFFMYQKSAHLPLKHSDVTYETRPLSPYSVKPMAYIFPQYYPFPENDRIWGENFTEWNNVLKATHNSLGLETIRPAESVGYYNGVAFETRQRQGKFLRDSGFYGAVYHHYWFGGKAVMDGVISNMLLDGEPNTPFMLNWANEPWTARWDGNDNSEVYIAQDYGNIEDWRKHFDWLLPYFRHPKYIRSEGRVQFIVYKPAHVGPRGSHMYAAWRQWAVEEGLGGLDVIETRWHGDAWKAEVPDAMNEFAPHATGFDHSLHSTSNRITRVYHRGTLACWDSTPRHLTDGGSNNQPFCHPSSFQKWTVKLLGVIKEDPNPIGAENFLFINALNEWGEGNALEPSVQFGDGYGRAMKKALEISDATHMWPDERLRKSLELQRTTSASELNPPKLDVCVVIRTNAGHVMSSKFNLLATLRSLIAQKNRGWKAIVVEAGTNLPYVDQTILKAGDPRIEIVRAPGGPLKIDKATDWVISKLNRSDPTNCGSARYILITDGDKFYEPGAFDIAHGAQGGLLGLNIESRSSIWKATSNQTTIPWADRCSRLETLPNTCTASRPQDRPLDLPATFIDLARLLRETLSVAELASSFSDSSLNWDWWRPPANECHVKDNPSYTACIAMGAFWLDSHVYSETGCYTTPDFWPTFGGRFQDFDLDGFRKSEKADCLKYTRKKYCSLVSCTD